MKKIIIFLIFLFFAVPLFAETIILKSGKKVEGKIIERNDEAVKIAFYGVSLTYYFEDIESIDGEKITIGESARIYSHNQIKKSSSQIFKDVSSATVIITGPAIDNIPSGSASGFIIGSNGVVLTALHVVSCLRDLHVETKNGKRFPVIGILAFDPMKDICLLKIDAHELPIVPLGDADSLRFKEKLFVIGAPSNSELSLSEGVFVSQKKLFSRKLVHLTAPLVKGNSGGPIVDSFGNAIGIVSFGIVGRKNSFFGTPINKSLKNFIQNSINSTSKKKMKILLNDFGNAVKYLEIAFQYNDQWKYDHPNASDCVFREDCIDENSKLAIEYYKKSLDSGIRNSYIYEHLGTLYCFALRDYNEGLLYIKKAVEINPVNKVIFDNYFGAYETKIALLLINYNYDKARSEVEKYSKELEEIAFFNPVGVSLAKVNSKALYIDWQTLPKKP